MEELGDDYFTGMTVARGSEDKEKMLKEVR